MALPFPETNRVCLLSFQRWQLAHMDLQFCFYFWRAEHEAISLAVLAVEVNLESARNDSTGKPLQRNVAMKNFWQLLFQLDHLIDVLAQQHVIWLVVCGFNPNFFAQFIITLHGRCVHGRTLQIIQSQRRCKASSSPKWHALCEESIWWHQMFNKML